MGGLLDWFFTSLRNYVTFHPNLAAEPIPLPTPRAIPRAAFVCANSLVVSDKAGTAEGSWQMKGGKLRAAERKNKVSSQIPHPSYVLT